MARPSTGWDMSRPSSTAHEGRAVNRRSMLSLPVTAALAWPTPMLAVQRQKAGVSMSSTISLTVGARTFTATLVPGRTTAAFMALLPRTMTMAELNGNEKYARLGVDLPTQSSRPSRIQAGEVMLYGADTLVIFYKSFATTYSYTRLGRIDDVTGLEAALGAGSVEVSVSAR
jgi:hypothetical protein